MFSKMSYDEQNVQICIVQKYYRTYLTKKIEKKGANIKTLQNKN